MTTLARCPNCEKLISLNKENPCRPFCSDRCRLIDFGEWLDESYTIPQKEIYFDETASNTNLKH